MSRRRSRRKSSSRAAWAFGGVGAALLLGGVGVGLYFLLRKPEGSDPSEWAPWLPPLSPPPMAPPLVYSTTQVEVLRSCRASSECPPGYVCVNGTCVTEAEWLT